MDDQGNVLIKRLSKSQVFVKVNPNEDNSVAQEITRLPNGSLEPEKPVKVSIYLLFNFIHTFVRLFCFDLCACIS
jgi:hypothetical protein